MSEAGVRRAVLVKYLGNLKPTSWDETGTPRDPAAPVEAYRTGMSREELHRGAYGGAFPSTLTPDQRPPV
jgi:hypothetical protein